MVSEAAAFKERPGDVVGEVAEAEGGAAEVFESAVDGFGGSVAGAGAVEVGQHVGGSPGHGAPEPSEFFECGGNAVADGGDHGLHRGPAAGPVGVAVGGDHALVDAPGRFDLDVQLVREQCLAPVLLGRGEQIGASVQGAAGLVEGIVLSAAAPVELLLYSSSALVQRIAGQADDVKRIEHRDRVGQFLVGCRFVAAEAVHGDDLDRVAPGGGACGEPLLEHVFRAAFDHVQQPGGAGASVRPGEVDDDGDVFVAPTRVPPHVPAPPHR